MSIPVTVNGVEYRSLYQACIVLKKHAGTIYQRIKEGFSPDEAFNLPDRNKTISRDHLGNIYPCLKRMAEAWNIPANIVRGRLNHGWDIKKALTTEVKQYTPSKPSTDYLGNEYPSISAMCKAYHIPYNAYRKRIDQRWSLKKALTTPLGDIEKGFYSTFSVDHLGNTYHSIKDMCKAWGVNNMTFTTRLNKGWSIEKALTTPPLTRNGRSKKCT